MSKLGKTPAELYKIKNSLVLHRDCIDIVYHRLLSTLDELQQTDLRYALLQYDYATKNTIDERRALQGATLSAAKAIEDVIYQLEIDLRKLGHSYKILSELSPDSGESNEIKRDK